MAKKATEAAVVSFNVLNNEKILAKFKSLNAKQQRDALKKATTKGTAEFRKKAKRMLPRRTGTLRKALATRQKTYMGGVVVYGLVGVRRKKAGKDSGEYRSKSGRKIVPELYMNVLESGTVKGPRKTKGLGFTKSGKPRTRALNRGEVKAGRYLERSAEATAGQSTRAFNKRFVQILMKHWNSNKVR